MVQIGIIGTGFMGRTHCAAYQKSPIATGIRLLTLPETRDEAEKLRGVCPKIKSIHTDADDFFQQDVDAFDICTPTLSHEEYIRRAFALGKPVCCEKPLTLDHRLALDLVSEGKRAGVGFMVAQVVRFWPEYRYLQATIEDGSLGRLRGLSMVRYSPQPAWGWKQWFQDPRSSGGALFDLHVHDIDFARHVLARPKRVSSVGYKRAESAYTDITTTLDFGDKLCATAYASYEMPKTSPFRMAYRALFEKGALEYDIWRTPTLLRYENERHEEIDLSGQFNGYEAECNYFAQCVAGGKMPELASAESAGETIHLLEQIGESADKSGEWRDFV